MKSELARQDSRRYSVWTSASLSFPLLYVS